MAFVYHAYYHVLNENGQKLLVDEQTWGEKRLTGDEKYRFMEDMSEALEQFIVDVEAGKIVVSDVEETINLRDGTQTVIAIGRKLEFPGATSRYVFSDKFNYWHEYMKQDPNLDFNQPVWVDDTV